MPAGRRLSNLLALAVLGVLVQRPMHPYEIASTLREYGKDASIQIKWGSLYTVMATLEKRGYVSAVGTTRQGGRPERTVYQITDAGREELADWLRELLSMPERESPRFEAALSLLAVLPPDEVGALLRSRLQRLEGQLAAERAAVEHFARSLPRLFLIEEEYHLALLAAEVDWVRALAAEFATGTFPGLAAWRLYHETGEAPPELFGAAGAGPSDGPQPGAADRPPPGAADRPPPGAADGAERGSPDGPEPSPKN